jgi:hypothetical protein
MKRLVVVALAGCVLPFVHSSREKPHPPDAVQRFADKTNALSRTPGAPSLPEVTYSMSAAVEALPDVKGGDQLVQELSKQAGAMAQQPDEMDARARASLAVALEALRRAKPSVKQEAKDKAVEKASRAIDKIDAGEPATLHVAYREIARAMVVVTGGGVATGDDLVTRFAVEEPDDARRTGAQALAAMADGLPRLPHPPPHADHVAKELRTRAERLATAPPLDYAGQLKDSLSLVVRSFDRAVVSPAQRRQLDEAKAAVDALRDDRPLALQHAAMAQALRLVSDAISAR